MPNSHLTKGSRQPAKVPGKLRLYSNEFCPYAHRVRLVLRAKDIDHDVVNINLVDKPEWYARINPEEKVPALDTGTRIILESLEIIDYLEEHYPNPPLFPSNSSAKQKDKELIGQICSFTSLFNKCLFNSELRSAAEWLDAFRPYLDVLENELISRMSVYFGGAKPGAVDYVIWPWAERAAAINYALGEPLPFHPRDYSRLRQWRRDMKATSVVTEMYCGAEKFWKVVLHKIRGITPDFDNVK